MQRSKDFSADQAALQRLVKKDNVALIVTLDVVYPALVQSQSQSLSPVLIVGNTHVHWNPTFSDVKLMQSQLLLEYCEHLVHSTKVETGLQNVPLLLCGDFNSTPQSGVYQFMTQGALSGNHPDFLGHRFGAYTLRGLRHALSLSSVYAEVMGDEPEFTNYTLDFVGVLDYIFFSQNALNAVAVLNSFSEDLASCRVALPNGSYPSDHLSLVADFLLK